MTDGKHIAALIKAQTEMGKLTKNSTNPHFKSKYADLTAVLETCTDALHSNGFAILQPSGKDEGGMFTDTVLMHESGGLFTTRVYWIGVKPDMQGSGSAMTYARRYGLMALTGLEPEDDDGAEASKKAPQKREPEPQREEVLTPTGSRDKMLAAIKAVQNAKQFTGLVERQEFKDALAKLAEADAPKALEVTAAMGAKRSAVMVDDNIPDFDKETGEVTQ
jgi:hypothetical protein